MRNTSFPNSMTSLLLANWKHFVPVAVWGLLANGCTYSISFVIQAIIDKAIPRDALASLITLTAIFIVIATIEAIAAAHRASAASRFASIAVLDVRQKFNYLTTNARAVALGNFKSSELVDCVKNLESVRNAFANIVAVVGIDSFAAAIFVVVFLYMSPALGMIALGGIACQAFIPVIFGFTVKKKQIARLRGNARATVLLADIWSFARSLHGADRTREMLAVVGKQLVTSETDAYNSDQSRSLSASLALVSGRIASAMTYFVGAILVMRADITFGQLVGFTVAMSRATSPLARFSNAMSQVQQASAALRAADIVINEVGIQLEQTKEAKQQNPSFEGRKLSFRYGQTSPLVFRRLDFAIKPGELTIVFGPSGVGKTTLLRTILGEVKPEEGKVLFSGRDVYQLDDAARLRNFHFLSARPQIFSLSVADNLHLSGHVDWEDSSMSQALAATQGIDANFWTKELLDRNAADLSNGQQQRIAIARALYFAPSALFIDEGTNGLDAITERTILSEIVQRYPKMVLVVCTHRESLLGEAANVINVERSDQS